MGGNQSGEWADLIAGGGRSYGGSPVLLFIWGGMAQKMLKTTALPEAGRMPPVLSLAPCRAIICIDTQSEVYDFCFSSEKERLFSCYSSEKHRISSALGELRGRRRITCSTQSKAEWVITAFSFHDFASQIRLRTCCAARYKLITSKPSANSCASLQFISAFFARMVSNPCPASSLGRSVMAGRLS